MRAETPIGIDRPNRSEMRASSLLEKHCTYGPFLRSFFAIMNWARMPCASRKNPYLFVLGGVDAEERGNEVVLMEFSRRSYPRDC